MTQTLDIYIPKLHPAQQFCKDNFKRYNTCSWGRRGGKTILGLDLASDIIVQGSPKRPDTPGLVGWFAPSYKLLGEAFDGMCRYFDPWGIKSNEQKGLINFPNGAKMEFWTLSNDMAGRSKDYDRVIVDECAFAKNLTEVWEASISPTLIGTGGDAFFFSTPKGRGNGFHKFYQMGVDTNEPEYASFHFPTSCNIYLPNLEYEMAAAKRRMSDLMFRQEIMAEFIENSGAVFRRVYEALDGTPINQGIPGRKYIIGVDWGRMNDYTAFSILDITHRPVRQVYLDRFNQIDYNLQAERLYTLFQKFPESEILVERNNIGDPILTQLQRMNLPVRGFYTTNASKKKIIENVSLAFERDALKILELGDGSETDIASIQYDEFLNYEQTQLPGGMIRYGAPSGMHDDLVMATAIAFSSCNPADMIWEKPIEFKSNDDNIFTDELWNLAHPRLDTAGYKW